MTTQTTPAVSTWAIDPAHSFAEFAAKHMMVATVKGRFQIAEGRLDIDEAIPARSVITATVDAASVDTGVEQRDAHLRSDDFFNVEKFPYFTFRSTGVEQAGAGGWKLTGDLTIRETTRSVEMDVEFEGRGIDAFDKERAGFTAVTMINRKEFRVNWNGIIEAGGVVVGDVVKITLHVAVVRQN
jgi:polyisoprenoid-binding protein YceI